MASPVLDIPNEGLPGEFWVEDGPRARGHLFWDDSGRPSIITDGVIRQPHTLRVTNGPHHITHEYILGPREIVADSVPVSILGTLDDGQAVTLRQSMLTGRGMPTPQTHLGISLLTGVHAPSTNDQFTSARFSVPQRAAWYRIFSSSDPVEVALGQTRAKLSAKISATDAWIELSIAGGLPSHEWERRFWYRCSTLMSLWVNDEVRPRRIQLKPPGTDTWVDQVWRRDQGNTAFVSHASLLPPQDLGLEHLAKALTAFEELGPIAEIASKDLVHETTLQTAVFLYASSLEGFHHHCYQPKRKPFPALSNAETKQIAQAAAQAAVGKACELQADTGDTDEATSRVFSAFQYFNQQTFNEQLQELIPDIQRVAPGLIGQDEKAWIEWVVAARNHEAHRRPKHTQSELLEQTEHLYQLGVSTQWALRLCVLLHLGIDGDTLRHNLVQHQRFLLALANMDRSEPSWPGSRLDEFLAATAA